MRLRQSREPWLELTHADWLALPDFRALPVQVRLLDTSVLVQALAAVRATAPPTGRCGPCRCCCRPQRPPCGRPHWCWQRTPVPRREHNTDMDILTRLCGHALRQTGQLLDRLVAARTPGAWRHDRETDELVWQLPQAQAWTRPVVLPGRHRTAQCRD
jgi:hypothetical protein